LHPKNKIKKKITLRHDIDISQYRYSCRCLISHVFTVKTHEQDVYEFRRNYNHSVLKILKV